MTHIGTSEAAGAAELFRLAVDAAPNGMVVIDADGTIVLANAHMVQQFGYAKDELLGQPVEMLVPERLRTRHPDYRAGFFAAPQARPMGVGRDLFGLRKDGSEIPVEIGLNPIETAAGRFVLAAIIDVSERKRSEELKAQQLAALNLAEDADEARKLAELRKEALAQVNGILEREVAQRIRVAAELARSNAELEQFAYVASHDLQEPLRMVGSYLELLAKRYQGQLDDKADRWIGFAVDAASRMKQLINDLLEFSRVNTHGKPLAPTDCSTVFDMVVANLGEAIRESAAVVTHGPLPTVLADRGQLTQLFQNLIGNAIKYCGERAPEIRVEAMRSVDGWQFSVRDNGIGIEPQFHERIFVIFQRLHTRAEYPGTGIGLALCRKIVERHAGRIWVASQLGQGATFSFTIPDRKDGSDEVEKPR
jgi:PAS domain S-box-containing protein